MRLVGKLLGLTASGIWTKLAAESPFRAGARFLGFGAGFIIPSRQSLEFRLVFATAGSSGPIARQNWCNTVARKGNGPSSFRRLCPGNLEARASEDWLLLERPF